MTRTMHASYVVIDTTDAGSGITINASQDVTSDRAGMTMGDWVLGQDLSNNGTHNWFLWKSGVGTYITCSATLQHIDITGSLSVSTAFSAGDSSVSSLTATSGSYEPIIVDGSRAGVLYRDRSASGRYTILYRSGDWFNLWDSSKSGGAGDIINIYGGDGRIEIAGGGEIRTNGALVGGSVWTGITYVTGGVVHQTDTDSGIIWNSDGIWSARANNVDQFKWQAGVGTLFLNTVWMQSNVIYLKNYNDPNHHLYYNGSIDGPQLGGYSKVRLFIMVAGSGLDLDSVGTHIAPSWDYYRDSSIKLKDNIEDLDPTTMLDQVNGLRPVTFTLKAETTNKRYSGLIAEWTEEHIPAVVIHSDEDTDKDIPGLSYSGVVPFLIGAVKALTTRLEAVEARVAV